MIRIVRIVLIAIVVYAGLRAAISTRLPLWLCLVDGAVSALVVIGIVDVTKKLERPRR